MVAVSEESGRPTLNVFGKLKKINVWGKGHAVTVSSGEGCVLHDGAQRQAWEGGMRRKEEGRAVSCGCWDCSAVFMFALERSLNIMMYSGLFS